MNMNIDYHFSIFVCFPTFWFLFLFYFQIMCAKDKSKYSWVSTNSANYGNDIAHKCPIVGGYDQVASSNRNIPLGTLHIGRTRQHGDVIIGNISCYDKKDPGFHYPLNDEEIRESQFEVLVYNVSM